MVRRTFTTLWVLVAPLPMTLANADTDQALQIDLQGVVESRCEINNVNSVALDFSSDSVGEINFNIFCNVAMSIALESENGALLNEDAAARHGFDESFARTYSATLSLAAFGFTRNAESADLRDGVSFDVTEGIVYDTTGAVRIELDAPLAGGYAGNYVDQIRITVAPSLAVASN